METMLFLAVTLIAVCVWRRLKDRTRHRGSRYYVPTFKASFDTWESKWSMSRRWDEDRAKARWQEEFDR